MDEGLAVNAGTADNAQPMQQPPALSKEQQEMVNRIVAREKAGAADKARREVEEKYQRELEGMNTQRAQQQGQSNPQAPREVNADAIYQQIQDRWQRDQERMQQEMLERQHKEHVTKVAGTYLDKIAQGKTNYPDFDEVNKDFDPTAFPQLTFLLADLDNPADVQYDLSKNPGKLAQLHTLAQSSPRMALSMLRNLSKSISDNRQAQAEAQTQNVSEPLDRLSPSRVSGSNGKMSVKDLRNQSWLRG